MSGWRSLLRDLRSGRPATPEKPPLLADANLPVQAPPGMDWALVKPFVEGHAATLVLVREGTRLDDFGFTLDEHGEHLPAGHDRDGQYVECEIVHWGQVRRASKRMLKRLGSQERIDAQYRRLRTQINHDE
jgi:hypothetical protein